MDICRGQMLTSARRVRYPNMCEGIMKIFVETGPGFDECTEGRRIEVDLKAPGRFSAAFISFKAC